MHKIIRNIFSNWTNLAVTMALAFLVSPVIVHSLGNENYGIWVLITSITGYFTVLDFGVNTAIVRYISMYHARGDKDAARRIYSNALLFFMGVSGAIVVFAVGFGSILKPLFQIRHLPGHYLFLVFVVVGVDFAISMIFSCFIGSLKALQEFFRLNVISIFMMVIKNIAIVFLLHSGYGLLSLALVQVSVSVIRGGMQYALIRWRYRFLSLRLADRDRATMKQVFSYSIYSFVIAISLKLLFFTDSLVIGSFVSLSAVTFYAIPMTLMTYLESFIYAGMSVLTPVISANNAQGNDERNKQLYIRGSQMGSLLSLPVLFVLFTNGDAFLTLWMGSEYGEQGREVIQILAVGYGAYLSQIVANSILKGMSRHKIFSYVLAGEAVVNLLLSIVLSQSYGIRGVALGTAIPLLVVNMVLVPVYCCHVLGLKYTRYIMETFGAQAGFTLILAMSFAWHPFYVKSYAGLIIYSGGILVAYGVFGFMLIFVLNEKKPLLKRLQIISRKT